MERITLVKNKNTLFWYDVLSFIIIYGLLAPILYKIEIVEFLYLKFFLILLFFFNCLFFLVCETKDKYKEKTRFSRVKSIT